jgi:hypothetical protein
MSEKQRSTTEILADADATLATAKFGMEDLLRAGGDRRLAGLSNVVVWGRAVTNVLQNLRSTEPSFDAWYAPIVEEMRNDLLLRFFYDLRSALLKRGGRPTSTSVHIKSLSFPGDMARFGPPPPNATSFFIGDQTGGSGWEVRLPDGSLGKYYVEFPDEIGRVELVMRDAPKSHLGKAVTDASVVQLAAYYLEYLENLVQQAKQRFGTASSTG